MAPRFPLGMSRRVHAYLGVVAPQGISRFGQATVFTRLVLRSRQTPDRIVGLVVVRGTGGRLGAGEMKTIAKLRPAVKWHGGKAYLARRIVALLPAHRVFVEPYAGGLSVLLNKPHVQLEVANDINPELIRLYRSLVCGRASTFLAKVEALAYDPETFEWACQPYTGDDPVEKSIRFLVRHRFSRGGLGRTFAWSDRQRGGRPGDLNAWETFKGELLRIASRLQGVRLQCRDALAVIEEFDGADTLFYLDPPYLPSTRTVRHAYRYEMTEADHRRLVETITRCRGVVALSGYANPLYDRALSSWTRHEFDMPNHAGQGSAKERRVEVLWVSPKHA